jgi:medium-chain acyl-[acyl-carrier-protein] hydrolase
MGAEDLIRMKDFRDEDFRVCTWDVDQADRLTMAAAFNFCQEVAGNHAREIGTGTEKLRESGMAWVLSRMSLTLDERPGRGARVTVRTWPQGWDRLFAMRGYQVLAPEGRVIGRGMSAWVVLNMATLRPQRPSVIGVTIPQNTALEGLADGARGIEPRADTGAQTGRRVGYSDIDYNGHANNARYVQWIQDVLPMDALLSAEALRMDINYLAEARPGDTALISYAEAGDGAAPAFHVEGVHEGTGRPCFRAVLTIARPVGARQSTKV